ncbi:MAG: transcription factor FapR [Clostridia bacterium]|nr:transcription factor FapR [Clostridia bacterium]
MARDFSKTHRQDKLNQCIEENPFLTDEELARLFGVSIQTIRLDRLELGIPELRERMKKAAEENYGKIKSLSGPELVGELLDLELGVSGLSVMEVTGDMVFQRTNIARGHHLFAQANSLAVAVVDAPMALTGAAKVVFKRPVYLGEKITAKAVVNSVKENKYTINVTSRVKLEEVLAGTYTVFVIKKEEENGIAHSS